MGLACGGGTALSERATGSSPGQYAPALEAATTQTPEIGADGTATIPVEFFYFTRRCQVNGIELIDGAGHVAVYGSYYAAPPLNLIATTTPDTTPPVAPAATLSTGPDGMVHLSAFVGQLPAGTHTAGWGVPAGAPHPSRS